MGCVTLWRAGSGGAPPGPEFRRGLCPHRPPAVSARPDHLFPPYCGPRLRRLPPEHPRTRPAVACWGLAGFWLALGASAPSGSTVSVESASWLEDSESRNDPPHVVLTLTSTQLHTLALGANLLHFQPVTR